MNLLSFKEEIKIREREREGRGRGEAKEKCLWLAVVVWTEEPSLRDDYPSSKSSRGTIKLNLFLPSNIALISTLSSFPPSSSSPFPLPDSQLLQRERVIHSINPLLPWSNYQTTSYTLPHIYPFSNLITPHSLSIWLNN